LSEKIKIAAYSGPAGGWGSVKSVAKHVAREGVGRATPTLITQNKPKGAMCVSCSWAKPADPHAFEFCENGAKATAWELTTKTVGPEFFADHMVSELLEWSDHDLEAAGRLTHPMRYDRDRDQYVAVSWSEAFAEIGATLRGIDPRAAIFYTSGRASLETSYLFQLYARLYGTNNLPDSSNMCHETTSVALPESIGQPVGTVRLRDFDDCDLVLAIGQNVGTNAPRMLHQLQQASMRGVPIVVYNPLRERGWERFTNPQAPAQMLTGGETRIASDYHQVRAGGDVAALMGVAKALIALDDSAVEAGARRVLDVDFIQAHCHGFEAFCEQVRGCDWRLIERKSGLTRVAMENTAAVYARSHAVIALYGMGLTQHREGLESIQMLVNLLLLRGNIGRPGAGICPVRGHSNVQGQRTVGISEKPELVPLDRLAAQYGFEPPRWEGMATVDSCQAILAGKAEAFISLGGNFIRAVPETVRMEKAWSGLKLSVQISTKLNRSHLVTAGVSYILPCLGRLERDEQETGPQSVTMEDSTACIHGSRGRAKPAGEQLLSEPAIVAGLAKATLDPNPRVDWDGFVADYARIRDAIESTYPDQFERFNDRMWTPGGFPRPVPAAERIWKTDTGKANFIRPTDLTTHGLTAEEDVLRLMTLRSNDQFNTSVYGYHDRFRGIEGTRMVVLVGDADMAELGLVDGDEVVLVSEANDQIAREVGGLRVVRYDLPKGCVAGYYPELNPLIPIWHHEERSKVPAAKSVPVSIRRTPLRPHV
jgi:molybdopterin-dependent oxidoreductase alpha subunit